MKLQKRTVKLMTTRILTLLAVLTALTAVFTSCSASYLGAQDLPEGTVALSLTDCIGDDGSYYVVANAVAEDGSISEEAYKLPLGARFVGEFVTGKTEDGSPTFFAGAEKFFEGSNFFSSKSPVLANSFILNDAGELILLTDALPEE